MEEIKLKKLWVVEADGIRWGAFRYKAEAKAFAILISGIIVGKQKLLTDKY